MKRLPVSS